MHPDAHYFIILLCPTLDDFTYQRKLRKGAANQWVNKKHFAYIILTNFRSNIL